MSKNMQGKDEEILWQSKINLRFHFIILLISLVVLVFGIIMVDFIHKFITTPNIHIEVFFLVILVLIIISITGLPLWGIFYPIVIWSFIKIEPRSYFATNNEIVDKRENKEYEEYYTFEYSKINKIEIRPRFFFKDRVASIRIFPKFNSTSPLEWRFKYFRDSGVKVPTRFERRYHGLYQVSDYLQLLKILKQHHVKIIKK